MLNETFWKRVAEDIQAAHLMWKIKQISESNKQQEHSKLS